MESITNAATAVTNAASSMLGYGNNNDATTTQKQESGQEPVSGLKGEGTVAEPFDQGNKVDDPALGGEAHQKTSTTGSSTHPTSSITGSTSSTTSDGLHDVAGRTARETADMVTSAPIQGQAVSGKPLSGTNSTSGLDTTYHEAAGTKTHVNAPTAVTSGSIAPNKHDGTSAITTKDTASSVTDHAIGSTGKHSHSDSLAPNIAAAGGPGTVTGHPATGHPSTHVRTTTSHTSSATGTSGVSGVDEHGSGKQKLSDKIKEKLHIGSEHRKH